LKLKPLAWRDARISNRWPRYVAETIVGNYEALQWSDGTFGGSVPSEGINKEFSCESVESAKEICQADFERRLSAAIGDKHERKRSKNLSSQSR